jgi:O-antigen ligase
MTLPLALMLLQSATGRLERFVLLVGIVLLAATIVKTQSRGAFIGALVVGAALLLLPGLSIGRRLFFIAAAAISMAVAAPAGYWTSMQTIVQDPKADYNWDSINGRRNLARRGIGYMLEYPVFGVGINNFKVAEGTISEKARTLAPGHGIRWASPHNSFVQAGAEAGILGLVLWVSLLLVNIVVPRRLRRRMPKSWRTGTPQQRFFVAATLYLPIATIGFAVTAFFVSFAWVEPLYFLSALVAGLSLIAQREFGVPVKSVQVAGFRTTRSRAIARVAVPPQSPARPHS